MQTAAKCIALLCLATCVGRMAAACTGKYVQEETIAYDFDTLSMNKLSNFYIMSGGYDKPTLKMYYRKPLEAVKEYISINSDQQKNNLMLDAVGDDKPCMELYIPEGNDFKEIKLEGSAEATLGNWTFSDFAITVNNGILRSRDFLFAEVLDLTVTGSGKIDLQTPEGYVTSVTSSISGGGNVTYTGRAENVEIDNVGYGFTTFGEVFSSMDVSLAGQGNTTVYGSEDLKVKGTAQPPCFIHVLSGSCKVTSEDANFMPCM